MAEKPVLYYAIVRKLQWHVQIVAVTSEANGKFWGRSLERDAPVCGGLKFIVGKHPDQLSAARAFSDTQAAIDAGKEAVGLTWRAYQRSMRAADNAILDAAIGKHSSIQENRRRA
ncbi:hypothetical protein [Hyphomonas sp.]|jgi:hypothetical protein|uniref:hypothetical protein n=1 Tax=Hyphomonas sp. TaxID=87 RepID=UPI0032EAE61D